MTTHGSRLKRVHYALESLTQGSVTVPILLWLDRQDYESPWPESLVRLAARGVHIHCSDGLYGPHTKYWGTFRGVAPGTSVVTADDDTLYPPWFLERLLTAAAQSPGTVIAHRAHRIELSDAHLRPYRTWRPVSDSAPSFRHFATGVSGVWYPPSLVSYVVDQGDRFMSVSPRADDVWLHLCALRSGHKVRQAAAVPRNFALVPMTQGSALSFRNTLLGGNDQQIKRAYLDDDVKALKMLV